MLETEGHLAELRLSTAEERDERNAAKRFQARLGGRPAFVFENLVEHLGEMRGAGAPFFCVHA